MKSNAPGIDIGTTAEFELFALHIQRTQIALGPHRPPRERPRELDNGRGECRYHGTCVECGYAAIRSLVESDHVAFQLLG